MNYTNIINDQPNFYEISNNILEINLIRLLKKKNLKIAVAESCTGGLISKKITDVPGSSSVFECEICAYSNNIKNQILKVQSQTLENFSAVSEVTAIEMANGIRELSGADIAVSVTGFAGLNSEESKDPVGLVYIGISSEIYTGAKKFNFIANNENEREFIREQAALQALILAQKIARLSRPNISEDIDDSEQKIAN